MRDWPTAKSQISIISCTSPSPSAMILPVSRVTSWPSSCFSSRSALPRRRTVSPRTGPGRGTPFQKRFMRTCNRLVVIVVRCGAHTGDSTAINRRNLVDLRAAAAPFAIEDAIVYISETKLFENRLHRERLLLSLPLAAALPAVSDPRLQRTLSFR